MLRPKQLSSDIPLGCEATLSLTIEPLVELNLNNSFKTRMKERWHQSRALPFSIPLFGEFFKASPTLPF